MRMRSDKTVTVYTIGFTKKSAENFFSLLCDAGVSLVVDVRFSNTSQLAGFAKYPDIRFFLERINGCGYMRDELFSPPEDTMKNFKAGKIDKRQYTRQIKAAFDKRDALRHIRRNYRRYRDKNICLLCSEADAADCHRSIAAEYFRQVFDRPVIHL